MLSRSDWRLSQSVGSLIVANTLVSSAKLVMVLLTLYEISLIKTRKSTGPNTVPCGTPLRTLSHLLTPPGILTCWRLFVKKLFSHSPSLPQMPNFFIYSVVHHDPPYQKLWHSLGKSYELMTWGCLIVRSSYYHRHQVRLRGMSNHDGSHADLG